MIIISVLILIIFLQSILIRILLKIYHQKATKAELLTQIIEERCMHYNERKANTRKQPGGHI